MKCLQPGCRVKNARWVVATKKGASVGERWGIVRLPPGRGCWCRTHARDKVARALNFQEKISGCVEIKDFLRILR
jgi:hypothetical protein